MPLELLRTIAGRLLPCTITDPAEIDRLRALRIAGYVAVFLPPVRAQNAFARVLAITAEGRKALMNDTAAKSAAT